MVASADQTIRFWKGDKMIRSFKRHTDVVRALCEIPHLGFASAGNDAYSTIVRLSISDRVLGSSTSGLEKGTNSSNFIRTQTLSTPSPSSPRQAKLSRLAKTEASKSGRTESVFRPLLSQPFPSGVAVRSPTGISWWAAAMAK